jgi:prepilin-type N-terminal cleavage/methylation domain-containing protein
MRAKSNSSTRQAGFTVVEMLVVIVVFAAVLGSITALIVASRPRLRRATTGAREIFVVRRATELLARDIRAAGRARAQGNSLVLTRGARDHITWLLRKGQLVRSAEGKERVFRPQVTAMRISIVNGFVEVGLNLPRTKRSRARAVYAAARLRAPEKKP